MKRNKDTSGNQKEGLLSATTRRWLAVFALISTVGLVGCSSEEVAETPKAAPETEVETEEVSVLSKPKSDFVFEDEFEDDDFYEEDMDDSDATTFVGDDSTDDLDAGGSESREFRNALATANSYISSMGFSEPGLRDQLAYEEYPEDAINYAMENVLVDYNEMALEVANSYQRSVPMSDSGLREQLTYEGFTEEQIEYAMANLDQ